MANTAPLVPITPGNGKHFQALRNISAVDMTCNVTVTYSGGTATYDLPIAAGSMIQNNCVVNTVAAGTLYGYLQEGQ